MKARFNHLLGATLCLLATLDTTHAAGKGKGGGGGGGGGGGPTEGTIYFYGPAPGWNGNPTNSISPDGSNQTVLGSDGWSKIFGEPSLNLHNGHRWLFDFDVYLDPELAYPDGSAPRALVALRDDYNPDTNNSAQTRAHLIDDLTDGTLQVQGAHWLLDDGEISFVGRRWSSDLEPVVLEGGIYTATVVFDADGTIAGLAGLPTAPTYPMPLESGVAYPWPDVTYYSWDPTGTRFVYTKSSDPYGVWVADLFGGETMITGDPGHMAEWSPDGRTIVYGAGNGFITIKPSGRRRTWILRPTSEWSFFHAYWSPDSSRLVCTGQSKLEANHDLFLLNADGSSLSQLTNTPAPDRELTSEFHAGWR